MLNLFHNLELSRDLLDLLSFLITQVPVSRQHNPLLDLLKILYHFCKLNPPRQELLVNLGIIPLLTQTGMLTGLANGTANQLALVTLTLFIGCSNHTRKALMEVEGAEVYMEVLEHQLNFESSSQAHVHVLIPISLNALLLWLHHDTAHTLSVLRQSQHTLTSMLSICNHEVFQ